MKNLPPKILKTEEIKYEFPCIEDMSLTEVSQRFAELAETHKDKLNVRVSRHYFDESDEYFICFDREETDIEYKNRCDELAQNIKSQEDRERAQFEALKKKYG